MDIHQQELQKAIEFVRQTFAEKKINLDYSPESVKHLDKLFDQEFKNGKLKRPDSSFARYQGLIMMGVSGYIAHVILKNAANTQLVVEPADDNWFLNYRVATQTGLFVQPGQRVVKRMLRGEEMELFAYVLISIKYFSVSPALAKNYTNISPDNYTVDPAQNKPWWKFW